LTSQPQTRRPHRCRRRRPLGCCSIADGSAQDTGGDACRSYCSSDGQAGAPWAAAVQRQLT
jgi:hypothetical protein